MSLGSARDFSLCRVISSVAGESFQATLDDEFSPSEQLCHPVSAVFFGKGLLASVLGDSVTEGLTQIKKKDESPAPKSCEVHGPVSSKYQWAPSTACMCLGPGRSWSCNPFPAECMG